MNLHVRDLDRLAHLAWVLRELLEVATIVRENDRCMGELRAQHLRISERGVHRMRSHFARSVVDRAWVHVHERSRHDPGCEALGVSQGVLHRIIASAHGVRGAILLREAIDAGLEDCVVLRQERQAALRAWERVHGPVQNIDLMGARIEQVIHPEAPAIQLSPPVNTVWGRQRIVRRLR